LTNNSIKGVILSDQVKSLDWRVRDAELIDTLPEEIMAEAFEKPGVLISP
jgi:mRNA-degrading endonuclease toxin of MazEF toxin-antitoxin module